MRRFNSVFLTSYIDKHYKEFEVYYFDYLPSCCKTHQSIINRKEDDAVSVRTEFRDSARYDERHHARKK